jgi:hypothetical protein
MLKRRIMMHRCGSQSTGYHDMGRQTARFDVLPRLLPRGMFFVHPPGGDGSTA